VVNARVTAILAIALGACSGGHGSLAVVTVDAVQPLTGITAVHASVTVGNTQEFDLPVSSAVSTPFTFGIDLPPSASGTISIHITCSGASGPLGAGDGSAAINQGSETDVTVHIGEENSPLDMTSTLGTDLAGTNSDLAGADLGSADLSLGNADLEPSLTCATFCSIFAMNCSGTTIGFSPDCLSYCSTNAGWPAGSWPAASDDTISCRINQAEQAASNPNTKCASAGATGNNVCGSWCTVYCDLMQRNCTGANAQFASTSACLSACAGFPMNGNLGDTSGNTIQCRLYFAPLCGENSNSASLHCPHAGPSSTICM
jgi:hypothetical protein